MPIEDAQLEAEIACAAREIRMRERVYPRWIGDGRMSRTKADDELATMRAIHARLTGLRPPGLL